ncbi:uridine diphosphate glucose pyrophosphatase NUDT14 isoform X2 [Nyctibius grandis]|uniref:uridine diphosphate glucose pyrophosphatase NUDT14 isoform X2 n=1 Tax=Nyctibius grandis TaxID=48427 RepID=UPI0035BC6DBD
MEAIEELALKPCTSSLYLRPFRLCYRQNGTKKFWDFMRTHDSVSILIFNTSRQCFVVVKQFRPAVYMCEVERHHPQVFQNQEKETFSRLEDPLPAVVGVTYELCAGIVDKPDLSLEEIACGEVLEECGYRVPVTDLRRITSYSASDQREALENRIGRNFGRISSRLLLFERSGSAGFKSQMCICAFSKI